MLAGFENLYEAPLQAFLMDVDSTEGTLPRREERQSGKTDEMTVENALWSHGGLVEFAGAPRFEQDTRDIDPNG